MPAVAGHPSLEHQAAPSTRSTPQQPRSYCEFRLDRDALEVQKPPGVPEQKQSQTLFFWLVKILRATNPLVEERYKYTCTVDSSSDSVGAHSMGCLLSATDITDLQYATCVNDWERDGSRQIFT